MHELKTVLQWMNGKPYVLLAGCDWDMQYGYVDVLPQPLSELPTVGDCEFLIDRYKPLQIRGVMRDTIWCELYDSNGKIDLQRLMQTGDLTYISKY